MASCDRLLARGGDVCSPSRSRRCREKLCRTAILRSKQLSQQLVDALRLDGSGIEGTGGSNMNPLASEFYPCSSIIMQSDAMKFGSIISYLNQDSDLRCAGQA